MRARSAVILAIPLLLPACAGQEHPASAPLKPRWAFEASDVPVDTGFHFGTLANGMRTIIRRNANPKGLVAVRMEVAAGSLDEGDSELGYAHLIEHMAFQGSSHVPSGEMVKLLERNGLAFGADTNAFTGYEQTTYVLNLPRNDPALLDTALMLMRETVSELSFPAAALAREKGVVLAEKRDRNSFAYRENVDRIHFVDPAARYTARMPIGTEARIEAATPDSLRAFWSREYVPAKTTLVIVGDIDPAKAEAAIAAHFGDWQPAPSPPQPSPGPVNYGDKGRTSIYLDPALSERVTISRHGPWLDEPDTVAQRREDLLRRIGYGIVNRRLQHLSHRPDPPFRDAGFGTGDVFKVGRTTNIVVDCIDGQWKKGLTAAALEVRRALAQGFTRAELDEQLANITRATEHAAAAADTRSDDELVGAAFALIRNDVVPGTPQGSLERYRAFLPQITPEAVLAALKRELVPLDDPLIRFQGRLAPEGGAKALRETWDAVAHAKFGGIGTSTTAGFAYTDFGTPGAVVADTTEPLLGIRELRFANGVRLNLKHTDIDKDRVLVSLALDGGQMLATRDNPLAVAMTGSLTAGGLGKHSEDDLETLLAGHQVTANFGASADVFNASAATTPGDLALQLQLMAAMITDPGYRPEGELQYRLGVNNWFAQLGATPSSALSAALGGMISDNDPRFALQPVEAYRALSFARLKHDIADRLAHGAIEIGIVGDVDEAAAIAAVARTFGALPRREADFRAYPEQRQRSFTARRGRRIVTHTGPSDQAEIALVWPTRDDTDPQAKQLLNLLERVVRIEITEALRQKLGKAYSPSASSEPTRAWKGYGTFSVVATVDVRDLVATRAAMLAAMARLGAKPEDADTLRRAREPLAETIDETLRANRGWFALTARAQSEPDRLDRQLRARARLDSVSAADLQAAAARWLAPEAALEVDVLPRGVADPLAR